MRTQTPAAKATTTKKNTTGDTTKRAVERIASQLEITTKETTEKLLNLAILHVDDNLMQEDEPFVFTGCIDSYSPTETLATMTKTAIFAIERKNGGKLAQRILYERDCAARGKQPEGVNMPDTEELLASVSKKLGIPVKIEVPAAVYRLADQLGRDPETLASEIMQAGIEALDDGLAHQPKETFDPVCFVAQVVGYSHFHEFTITGWIERMSPKLLADCQEEATDCEQTLQQIVMERCNRGADLKQLAQPDIDEEIEKLRLRAAGQ